MPLIAHLVCVLAAVGMLWSARGTASRAAHGVVLVVMLDVVPLGFVGALVLIATAALLGWRQRDPDGRSCAVDVAACAGLVALMGVAMSSHHMMHATRASTPLVLGASVLVLGGWALARSRTRTDNRAGGIAAWVMMLAMVAMVGA